MIENRTRIEKQIYLGRQLVRRSLRPVPRLPESSSSQVKHNLRITATPPPTGSDYPLSLDTDAEQAIVNGSSRIFRRNHSHSRNSTVRGSTPSIQRKTLQNEPLEPTSSSQRATPMATTQSFVQTEQPSFLTRLRTKSFPSGSLLSTGRDHYATRPLEDELGGEHLWSSDSSFGDDLSADEGDKTS